MVYKEQKIVALTLLSFGGSMIDPEIFVKPMGQFYLSGILFFFAVAGQANRRMGKEKMEVEKIPNPVPLIQNTP